MYLGARGIVVACERSCICVLEESLLLVSSHVYCVLGESLLLVSGHVFVC
jgi:hypothetical protein